MVFFPDYMPTLDPNWDAGTLEATARTGFFLGYVHQPGGKCSIHYLVADSEGFRLDPDLVPSTASIHRTKELITTAWTVLG